MKDAPLLLGGVAFASSLALVGIAVARQNRVNAMTEAEILERLSWGWLGRSDRKMLEQRLSELRASRPAPSTPPARASAPAPRRETRSETPAGAVEIPNSNGAFRAVCSIVARKAFEGIWDTGAVSCKICHEVAKNHLGIRRPHKDLPHDMNAITAGGGMTAAAKRRIDWVVAGILVPDVETMILHEDKSDMNLIGMSLISKLPNRMKGDRLLIYPPR